MTNEQIKGTAESPTPPQRIKERINTMKEEIEKLKDGEVHIVPESDYGKAEIWFKNNMYFLFEIPMYGGEPRYVDNYIKRHIGIMIEKIESWT